MEDEQAAQPANQTAGRPCKQQPPLATNQEFLLGQFNKNGRHRDEAENERWLGFIVLLLRFAYYLPKSLAGYTFPRLCRRVAAASSPPPAHPPTATPAAVQALLRCPASGAFLGHRRHVAHLCVFRNPVRLRCCQCLCLDTSKSNADNPYWAEMNFRIYPIHPRQGLSAR